MGSEQTYWTLLAILSMYMLKEELNMKLREYIAWIFHLDLKILIIEGGDEIQITY